MATKKPKLPKSSQEFLDHLPDEYLHCREMHHQWKREGVYKNGPFLVRRQICLMCNLTAWVTFRGGDVVRRIYDYENVPGYLYRGNDYRPIKRDYVLTSMKRTTIAVSEDQLDQILKEMRHLRIAE